MPQVLVSEMTCHFWWEVVKSHRRFPSSFIPHQSGRCTLEAPHRCGGNNDTCQVSESPPEGGFPRELRCREGNLVSNSSKCRIAETSGSAVHPTCPRPFTSSSHAPQTTPLLEVTSQRTDSFHPDLVLYVLHSFYVRFHTAASPYLPACFPWFASHG